MFAYRALGYLSRRSFSSRLVNTLQQEIDYEKENYAINQNLQQFLRKYNYEVVDEPNNLEIHLKRYYNGYDISIAFQARSSQDFGQEMNENDDGEEFGEPLFFTVAIQKPNQTKAIIYDCYFQQKEVQVQNITQLDDFNANSFDDLALNTKVYKGPEFQSLDDKLQIAINEHVRQFQIDNELAEFIEDYSFDKEQRLYMSWLQDYKNFLS